ncbi:MAG: hypothetical protein ACE5D7_02295 [Fidelibacterota bacterium]
MMKLKTPVLVLLSVVAFVLMSCEDKKSTEKTTAEKLVGVWYADASVGSLGNTTASSGSLAGAGWTTYQLTLNADGSFAVEGANGYDIAPYGDGDGIINYSGTYTIDDTQDPMWIDLTCTASDNVFFTTADSLQPMQPGIFELDQAGLELTIQYGAKAYAIPRPSAFLDAPGPGSLVKQ